MSPYTLEIEFSILNPKENPEEPSLSHFTLALSKENRLEKLLAYGGISNSTIMLLYTSLV